MREALYLVASLLCSVCGMAWIALAMPVHWKQVRDTTPAFSTRLTLRCLGVSALLSSLALCLASDHASMASLVWIMSLAASALIVAFTLSYRPHTLGWLLFGHGAERADA